MTAAHDTDDTSRRTFVDEGSAFHGTFESTCPIVVSGSIRGHVTAPQVTIDPLGAIDGDIKADKLISNGALSGTVDAVHVLLSGSVSCDTFVRAEQLDVKLRAEHGRLEMTFGARKLAVVPEAPALPVEVDVVEADVVEADVIAAEVVEALEGESAGLAPSGDTSDKTKSGRRTRRSQRKRER